MENSPRSILMETLFQKLTSPTLTEVNVSKSFVMNLERLQNRAVLIQEQIQQPIPNRAGFYYPVPESGLIILVVKVDELLDELNIYAFRQKTEKIPFLTLQLLKIKLLRKLKKVLHSADFITLMATEQRPKLETLVGKLLVTGSETPLVVPIPGLATRDSRLAKRAYDIVRSHFDLRIWIHVGGIFYAGKTMNGIFERLSGGNRNRSELLPSELPDLLRESLLGKRYLLVLEDVSYVEQAEWDKLKYPLGSARFGSKVIVTVENLDVVRSMRTFLFLPVDDPLQLSYKNLPPLQRHCFSYCSMFPVNYKINRQKLIHQWFALGLIPSLSGKHMEETGDEYLDNLLSRFSFFRGVSADDDGKFQEFTIDEPFAQFKSLFEDEDYAPWLNLEIFPTRAFHLINETDIASSRMHSLFTYLKHLHVINLSGCGLTKLSESLGNLIHLRYIDLSNTLVQKLPKNICFLFNLQSLHLSDCKHLRELPHKMSNLINLRHLNTKGCESLARMPANIGKLQKLQTLSMFIIGNELEESLFQLKHLDLRGELEIKQLEKTGYLLPDMCLEYKLLQSLVLSWGSDNEAKMDNHSSRHTPKGYDSCHAESVLNCLLPNRSLRNLCINEYPGSKFPQWLNRIMLPNLTKLVLFNCRRCETLPVLGPLQSLRVLHLQGMDAVVSIGSEFFGKNHGTKLFPSLCELILKDLPALRFWESTGFVEVFPCLNKLSVINCPMLISTPSFPSLRHLDIHNCNKLILRTAEDSSLFSNLAGTLQNLEISSCTELQDIPDWMESLTSLQSLAILHCQNLKSLPEGLKHLRALQSLSVGDCPELERRCQKDTGEDWHKILHVPCVHVGSATSQKRPDGATNSSS